MAAKRDASKAQPEVTLQLGGLPLSGEGQTRIEEALRRALEAELHGEEGIHPLDWHARGSVHSKAPPRPRPK